MKTRGFHTRRSVITGLAWIRSPDEKEELLGSGVRRPDTGPPSDQNRREERPLLTFIELLGGETASEKRERIPLDEFLSKTTENEKKNLARAEKEANRIRRQK